MFSRLWKLLALIWKLATHGPTDDAAPQKEEEQQQEGGHDPFEPDFSSGRPNAEPLSEFVNLLAGARGDFFDAADDRPLAIGEPISVPSLDQWLGPPPVPSPPPAAAAARPPNVSEQAFRPVKRPPTPLLTILDDTNAMTGETVRIRGPECMIGRNEGMVTIPHDKSMSSRHARIFRHGDKPPYAWYLKDEPSKNGTFVCCENAPLRTDRIVMLGSRRFRLVLPPDVQAPSAAASAAANILAATAPSIPMLMETTVADNPVCIRLASPRVTVGRPGFNNDVEIDDPLLGGTHAEITQAANGTWWIKAMPSRNGVWIQVDLVKLSESCRFQCGEQRFMFTQP